MQMGYEYTLETASVEASGIDGDSVDVMVSLSIRKHRFYYAFTIPDP